MKVFFCSDTRLQFFLPYRILASTIAVVTSDFLILIVEAIRSEYSIALSNRAPCTEIKIDPLCSVRGKINCICLLEKISTGSEMCLTWRLVSFKCRNASAYLVFPAFSSSSRIFCDTIWVRISCKSAYFKFSCSAFIASDTCFSSSQIGRAHV